MKILNKTLSFIDWVNDRAGRLLSLFVLMMFGLILMEVFRRYVLNSPTAWSHELTQMFFGVYVVLSGGYILRWGGHVNVDILYSRFSTRTKAGVDIVTSVLFFMFCGMMVYYGGSLAWDSLRILEHSESAWNPPLYPIKLAIPLGASLLLLQGIAKLIRDILIVFKGEEYRTGAIQERETL